MQEPESLCQLRRKLVREGFSRGFVRRITRELQDHWSDLREERLATSRSIEEAEAFATRALGTAEELSEAIRTRMRASSWWGRHPILGFGIAPVPVLLMVWVGLIFLSSWASGMPGESVDSNLAQTKWESIQSWVSFSRYASAGAVAGLFCFFSSRYFCGVKAALVCCAVLTLHNLCNFVRLIPPTDGREAILTWGYGLRIPAMDFELVPDLLPMAVFCVFYLALRNGGASQTIKGDQII